MIGVFDSGFGGLTVLASLLEQLPAYDYTYLGDSARAPYGTRSPDAVLEFTREAVEYLFAAGCPLVVLACNTSSARALRTLQQRYLPARHPDRRILGVVRPSAEALAGLEPGAIPGRTTPSAITGTVAIVGTPGTVASDSYHLELAKLAPGLRLVQQACPLWVPLVEAGELSGPCRGRGPTTSCASTSIRSSPRRRSPSDCCSPARTTRCCCRASGASRPRRRRSSPRARSSRRASATGWSATPRWRRASGGAGERRYLTTDDPAWFAARGETILGRPIAVEKVRLQSVG